MRRQNELADLQYQLKVDYFNQIKEDQANTRALWHDIRKYLNTMNELISEMISKTPGMHKPGSRAV